MAIDVKELYKRFGPMVHRRCQRLLGDRDEAADAMHDVFVQLVRRQEELTPIALSSLLYTIATNVSLNRIRTRSRHPETHDERLLGIIATTEGIEKLVEQKSLLGTIFKDTPALTREIAVMHYVDRMTLKEVARAVGMSVSGVRKRLRLLQKHASELEEMAR